MALADCIACHGLVVVGDDWQGFDVLSTTDDDTGAESTVELDVVIKLDVVVELTD